MAATITFFSGETTSSGLWCRGACACLCQEEGEKCNQCHRGCTSKSSRLSSKNLFNCRSKFCLQVTFKEVAFLTEVDLKQVSLSFQLAHNLDQPCPDGDLQRVPEKASSLRDRWSCSTRGLGQDQVRGRCR